MPRARPLTAREQLQVDYYRGLRERYHDGPYYSILDSASTAAKKGSLARANFDSFHGMPTYSGRYQRKKRTMPRMGGRSYSEFSPCLDIVVWCGVVCMGGLHIWQARGR